MSDERNRSDAGRAATLYAFILFSGRQLKTFPDANRFDPYHVTPAARGGQRDLRGMLKPR